MKKLIMFSLLIGLTTWAFAQDMDYNQKVVVGNNTGADYTSLNTAYANIGTDGIYTFYIVTPVTLTANISFTSGVTIIIGATGSLGGGYTLTGDNTQLIFESHRDAFDAKEITFEGSWICDPFTVEQFGAVGDQTTDDSQSIDAAHDFARLTDKKTVIITGKYYIDETAISVTNTHDIFLPGSEIIPDYSMMWVWIAQGGLDDHAQGYLSSNANIGDDYITCTDTALLNNLNVGDLIFIKSSKYFAQDLRQGEQQRVRWISGNIIYFDGVLYDKYNTSDSAIAYKVNAATYSHTGTLKIKAETRSGDEDAECCVFLWMDGLCLNVDISNFRASGVLIEHCYEPRIIAKIHNIKTPGLGYGVTVNGSTMRADITGSFLGNRAGVNFGGSNTGGVPWDCIVHDATATIVMNDDAAGFMMHYTTGSASFINCNVIGVGVSENAHAGFTLNSRRSKLINCSTYNVHRGIYSTGDVDRNVDIENFNAVGCQYGLTSSDGSPIKSLTVDGFNITNDECYTGLAFDMNGADIAEWSFNDINIINLQRVFSISNISESSYPEKLIVNGLTHRCPEDDGGNSITLLHSDVTDIILNDAVFENIQSIIYSNSVATGLKRISIGNLHYDMGNDIRVFDIYNELDILRISNANIFGLQLPATSIAYCRNGITTLALNGVHIESAGTYYLGEVPVGQTWTNLIVTGCDFINLYLKNKLNSPTNTIGASTCLGL